jgi:hypothetical protein
MCELAFNEAEEWHGMCESALSGRRKSRVLLVKHQRHLVVTADPYRNSETDTVSTDLMHQ